MTKYLRITSLGDLLDLGQDETKTRIQLSFNVICKKVHSSTFLQEIVSKLVEDDVGVFNENIFAGSNAKIPAGAGPFLLVKATGGTAPDQTHNETVIPAYPQPSAQVIVAAKTYEAANTMANAAWLSLVGVRNRDIAP